MRAYPSGPGGPALQFNTEFLDELASTKPQVNPLTCGFVVRARCLTSTSVNIDTCQSLAPDAGEDRRLPPLHGGGLQLQPPGAR